MMHRTIDPFFRRLFITAALCLLLYALYLMRIVIAPFLAAFILAYFLNPLVNIFNRFLPRIPSIMAVYLSIIVLLTALMIWLAPLLWAQLQLIWESLPASLKWYNEVVRPWLGQFTSNKLLKIDLEVISSELSNFVQTNYQFSDAQVVIKRVLSSGMNVANNLGLIIMIPILTFYFLANWHERLQTWQTAIPRDYEHKITAIVKDCDEALMNFAKGQFSVMILLGAIYAIQLELIGLELGLIIGIGAGIASFVPYLGFGVGIIAALIAGFFQFGLDWKCLLLIVGAFGIGQILEGYVLQPLLLGNKIGLSALWVIFSVLAGASLFGFIGMLIALPVSALINVLFRHAYATYLQSNWYLGYKQSKLW
ncbi:AI-2E family transporter [Moraxella sp. ZY200743]|uniref:AI-2E family transporter n=1 Tax=Moraxella sp. ZY200743 TaxID=2911970 RepID=UPI003D7C391C